MKLVILGNGFDLHHGLPTSFNDFRTHLLESDLEENILLVEKIDELIIKYLQSWNRILDDFDIDWREFEIALYEAFKDLRIPPNNSAQKLDNRGLNKLQELETLHETFSEKFEIYLGESCEINDMLPFNPIIQEELGAADLILTFNYTRLYKMYTLRDSVTILHMHGTLDGDIPPIIGYETSQDADVFNPKNSTDYIEIFNGRVFSKSSLIYKFSQEDSRLIWTSFFENNKEQVHSISSLGFSYGESDGHISNSLNSIIAKTTTAKTVPVTDFESLDKISVDIFAYSEEEFKRAERFYQDFFTQTNRTQQVKIFGQRFKQAMGKLASINQKHY